MSDAVVVVTAHAFEARAAASVGRDFSREPWGQWMLYRGEVWDRPMAVIRTGPGKVSTAAATQAAIQYLDPALVMSFGVAVSPNPATEVGTLVVASQVVDVALTGLGDLPIEVSDRWQPDETLAARLSEVPGTITAPVLSWEGTIASPSRRPLVAGIATGIEVIDWETAAVAQVCSYWRVPWGALRVVSDHGEPDRLRRLAVVARRPLQWAAEAMRRGCHAWFDEQTVASGARLGEESFG